MNKFLKESFLVNKNIYMDGKYVVLPGFSLRTFKKDLKRKFKNTSALKMFSYNDRSILGLKHIKMHQFFIPELLYILNKLPERYYYNFLKKQLLKNTWVKRLSENSPNININFGKINKNLNVTLKPYQLEFFKKYLNGKYKYALNGYILAFEQGLGKTITSLALMKHLDKKAVIIIAPKNTIQSVWINEIKRIFNDANKIWIPGMPVSKVNYYIVNYERIGELVKMKFIIKSSKNIGIIIDECHNFRHIKTKRVTDLRKLSETLNCTDILMMSGTPIKALGYELVPALYLLDPMFDDDAMEIFVKLTRGQKIGLEILQNRIQFLMHRKLKSDVLNLPKKIYKDIKIRIPNSNKYTINNIRKIMEIFIKERMDFYNKNKKKYKDDFNECVEYLKQILSKDGDFIRWIKYIDYLKKNGYTINDPYIKENLEWANIYEKYLIKRLPTHLKNQFKNSKSVVKYVSLKILGEVLGGLLNKLRSEMYEKMIHYSPTCEIINNSEKKTIIYTTFVPIVKSLENYTKTKCGSKPITIYGETKNVPQNIAEFKSADNNPLIATIQSLSTGVTLVEANTIIFINPPWRSTDKQQAEDRIHRIGQDSTVYIYNYTLDTGSEPNLSTRMDDIIDWSKSLFSAIMEPGEKMEMEKVSTMYKKLY